jgi:intein/homing endonuclease
MQLEALQDMYKVWGRKYVAQNLLFILRKNPEPDTVQKLPSAHWNRRLVPFQFNRIQRDLDRKMGLKNICNKPRQAGYTTFFINTRLYLPAFLEPGTTGMLVSQNHHYATMHFSILKRAHRYVGCIDPWDEKSNVLHRQLLQNLLHTSASTKKELIFDQIDSRITIESAEVEEAGQGYCVHPRTWIMTADNRLIKYKHLKVGDLVLDENGEPVEISKVFSIPKESHRYKGEARKITLRCMKSLPVTCAPNHPFLTQRGMVEAQDLIPGKDYFAYPRRKLTEEIFSFDLTQYHKFRGILQTTPYNGAQPKEVILDRDMGLVCGLFLADGFLGSGRSFSIVMVNKRKIAYARDRVLNRMQGLVENPQIKRKGLKFNGKIFASWLEDNFGRSKGKHIPDWWYKAPKEFLIGLLEGWLTGDGWWFNRGFEAYGKIERLVLGMREISIALGSVPYLYFRNKKAKWTKIKGVKCLNRGRRFQLLWQGPSAEKLYEKFRLPFKIKDRKFRRKSTFFDKDFVYIKVDKVEKTKCKRFLDITVKSKSHLYCLPQGVTHNTLQHLVCTEVARWPGNPEATMANIKEALAAGGTYDIESTPNGMGGYYYEEWKRAESNKNDRFNEFVPHFHPWFWHDEYRIEENVLSFEELNEEEQHKQQLFNLDLEQMTWRRKKMVSLRHEFKEKYPEDSTTCFITSGRLFFDQEVLAARIAELQVYKPLSIERNGEVVVFHKPVKGRQYVFGLDVAEGKGIIQAGTEVGDWTAGKMIDLETGEECLAYRVRTPPEDAAADAVEICEYYNNAMFSCERNNHGGTVILAARQLGYGNIYKHKEWWKREANQDKKRWREFEGWPTTTKTRKILLNQFAYFVRTYPELVWDLTLIQECFTFTYNEKGVPAAMEGHHDDCVMGAAVAHIVRLIVKGYLDPLYWRSHKYGTIGESSEELEDTVSA